MVPISRSSLSAQEKQARFAQIRKDTMEGIRRDHDRFTYRIYGWCRNKYHAVFGLSETGLFAAVAKAAVNLALLPLRVPMLNIPVNAVVRAEQARALAKDMQHFEGDEKLTASGEWLVVKGAEAFKDAVRKVDDAAQAFNNRPAPANCDEFCEWVKDFYYWRYRLQRLRHYQKLLQDYLSATQEKLDEAVRMWDLEEAKMNREGPKIFDDWRWHAEHCRNRETCVFPWQPHLVKAPPPPQGQLVRRPPPPPGPKPR